MEATTVVDSHERQRGHQANARESRQARHEPLTHGHAHRPPWSVPLKDRLLDLIEPAMRWGCGA
jgi:hypothetical protein